MGSCRFLPKTLLSLFSSPYAQEHHRHEAVLVCTLAPPGLFVLHLQPIAHYLVQLGQKHLLNDLMLTLTYKYFKHE